MHSGGSTRNHSPSEHLPLHLLFRTSSCVLRLPCEWLQTWFQKGTLWHTSMGILYISVASNRSWGSGWVMQLERNRGPYLDIHGTYHDVILPQCRKASKRAAEVMLSVTAKLFPQVQMQEGKWESCQPYCRCSTSTAAIPLWRLNPCSSRGRTPASLMYLFHYRSTLPVASLAEA